MDWNEPFAGCRLEAFAVVAVGGAFRDEEAVNSVEPMDVCRMKLTYLVHPHAGEERD